MGVRELKKNQSPGVELQNPYGGVVIVTDSHNDTTIMQSNSKNRPLCTATVNTHRRNWADSQSQDWTHRLVRHHTAFQLQEAHMISYMYNWGLQNRYTITPERYTSTVSTCHTWYICWRHNFSPDVEWTLWTNFGEKDVVTLPLPSVVIKPLVTPLTRAPFTWNSPSVRLAETVRLTVGQLSPTTATLSR